MSKEAYPVSQLILHTLEVAKDLTALLKELKTW